MIDKIAIVGGGISGLSAAYFAASKGIRVDVFEKSDRLGGLAASFNFDNLIIEKFYHFICMGDDNLIKLANRLKIDNKIIFKPTKTAFFYNGKYYPFGSPSDLMKFSPLPILQRLRFGQNVIKSKYLKKWEKLDGLTAKAWICETIGEEAYDVIWHPLLKVKFGDNYDKISAAWIWHRIHRIASSRKNIFSKERMGYFLGGTHILFTQLEKKILEFGGSINLNSEIQTIEKKSSNLIITLHSGKQISYKSVILAVPLPIASKLIKNINHQYSKELSSIDFIGVVCGIFRMKKNITDAFWLNINDPKIRANGFIEYTNLNLLTDIWPDRIIYIPFYLPTNENLFIKGEEELKTDFFEMLRAVNVNITRKDIINFRAFKAPHAQAVCKKGFKDYIPPIKTPINNLFLLDSTQLYPSDRSLSGLIGLAEKLIHDNF